MAKKQTPDQQIKHCCQEALNTIFRWKSIRKNGCYDPGYPDGVSMNLLRNHLKYHKGEIKRLCSENRLPLPAEALLPDLPYVDQNYFADPKSERSARIMGYPNWRCFNQEKPSAAEYDDTMLVLF